jgi:hypothetical protein
LCKNLGIGINIIRTLAKADAEVTLTVSDIEAGKNVACEILTLFI